MIAELHFNQLDDDGKEMLNDDGEPEIVNFSHEQIRVRTKLIEIMPAGLVQLMSELLALFRPLE